MAGIVKGSLTGYQSGARLEFMFNPSQISDKKAINFGRTQVPHVSHPVYQFGSGGERAIAFQLYLDGDRGSLALRGGSQDISPQVRLFRALMYPAALETAQTGGDTSPYWVARPPEKVIFNYGTMWQGILCVVTQADITGTFFSPSGELVRCTLDIGLEETPPLPVFANDIRTGAGGGG
jgi:hypothetical protein